jgi:hypothetical protein
MYGARRGSLPLTDRRVNGMADAEASRLEGQIYGDGSDRRVDGAEARRRTLSDGDGSD